MKRAVILFAAIAVSMVFSSYCNAQEKRLALVIGNSSYKHYSPLKNPVNDAKDMAQALEKLDFDVMQRFNVGKQDMEDAIRDFGKQLATSEVGFFYFSGHGSQMNGENYLLPSDALISRESDIEYKMVHVRLILDEMKDAKNRLNVIILDACRTNPFPRSGKNIHIGLAPLKPPTGMLIAYAASPNEQAFDDLSGKNSFYTANLLKYMTVEGITLEQYFKRVREGVLSDTANRQKSWEETSLTGKDFYFVEAQKPPISASTQQQSIKTDPEPIKNSSLSQQEQPVQPKYKLRSEPYMISTFSMTMDDEEKKLGLKDGKPLEYINNEFKDNGDTITDYATGLIWQKSGSETPMTYKEVDSYIEEINIKKIGGYRDWRLPTVNELTSLLKPNKQTDGLQISPIFDSKQLWCWTSDSTYSLFYVVYFNYGYVKFEGSDRKNIYVRAVRSLTP